MKPQMLKTSPLDHQRQAIAKLKPIKVGGLFMEMGTGKTLTVIALAVHRAHKIDKVVYLCPVDLKTTVAHELSKHLHSPSVYVFDDKTTDANIPDADWCICGIESIGQSDRVTLALNSIITEKTFVVLDESDTCKNHAAKRTMRITEICKRSKYRLIMTGTAVGEGVEDLYAPLYFLSPKILGYNSFYSFAANHLEYSEDYPSMVVDNLRTDYIAKRLEPYVYQVKKEECLDLPERQYVTRYFDPSWQQRDLYRQAKDDLLGCVPDDEIDSYTIFRLFTALREIVSGFWNRTAPHDHHWWDDGTAHFFTCDHDRVALLRSVLNEIDSHEPVIVWCNFDYSIQQITESLGEDVIATYYGKTEDRDAELAKWKNGKARILVASPRCGGRGIDLTHASYAIFYNNDFPYRLREQAEARNHRMGQTRPVTYIDLVCDGTIDDKITRALWAKENLVQQFKKELKQQQDKRSTLLNI